jgi:hypothetical protein
MLISTSLFGQTKQEQVTKQLTGTWVFKKGFIVKTDIKFNSQDWGRDTLTFESNQTYHWYSPCADCGERTKRKYFGTWHISQDGQNLILSNTNSDPYLPEDELDKLGNTLKIIVKKDELTLYHTILIKNEPNVPKDIKPKDGTTKAKINYTRISN